MEKYLYINYFDKLIKKIGINMLNKIERQILGLFLRNPSERKTMYSISNELGKYFSQVQRGIKNLETNNILSVERVGSKTSLCSVNFSKADVDALCLASIDLKKKFLDKNLKTELITQEIEEKLADELFVLVVFGSQVKGTSKKNSDIDLCFISQNPEILKDKLNAVLSSFSYKLHINIFTPKQFYEMLKLRSSVGREILNSSIVLKGHDLYYNLVKQYDKEYGYSKSD